MIGTVDVKGGHGTNFGVAGVNDNDIVIETDDISRFWNFYMSSHIGAMAWTYSTE